MSDGALQRGRDFQGDEKHCAVAIHASAQVEKFANIPLSDGIAGEMRSGLRDAQI